MNQPETPVRNQVAIMASRLNVEPAELQNIVINTIMPNRGQQVSNEQFVSFLAVANEYKLNPMTKEIYAFPAKGGGIQPIVSIDGWLKMINSHPDFNGMVHEDVRENGQLVAVTCKIYRKGIEHPITVTEYMDECRRGTDTWKQWPARMLRHKATIQAGRYAFGLSGIVDPDEAERIQETEKRSEKPVHGEVVEETISTDELKELLLAIQSAGIEEKDFCRTAGIPAAAALQASRFRGAMANLSQKAERRNQEQKQ